MFDLFNSTQNPFVSMMNMAENADSDAEDMEEASNGFGFPMMPGWNPGMFGEEGMSNNPMMFMQQMFMMNMMFMQQMWMMPMQFMKAMMDFWSEHSEELPEAEETKSAPAGGFKLGNMNIPPELLTKLMEMDMSPENLQKLQKVLDVVFSAVPEEKSE